MGWLMAGSTLQVSLGYDKDKIQKSDEMQVIIISRRNGQE